MSHAQAVADRMRPEIVAEALALLETYRPPKPRKLIVSTTVARAKAFIEAFGLSPSDWEPIAISSSLRGRKFDRIIVDMPETITDDVKNAVTHLRPRLTPEGELHFL